MNMRALVTGGAGFVGSNLSKKLASLGHSVDIVDNLSGGYLEFLPSDCSFINDDFASQSIVDRIKSKSYDVVFHIAAVPRVSYSIEHPVETNDVNVSRTLKLLNACRDNVNRVVFASSSSVYGNAESLPISTKFPKKPMSPYALQKSIIEDYLKIYHELYGLDSAVLRFFNVFGPNQLGNSPYSTAIGAWLTAIHSGAQMRSDGDGTQSRDLCYVDNVVDACIKSAESITKLKAEPVNVACGDQVTNREILQHLLSKYPDAKYYDAPWRPGDVMHTRADISRTTELIGYTPSVRFWEGLDRTIKWYDENWDMINRLGKK